jgi:ionotropic glutamate receptor
VQQLSTTIQGIDGLVSSNLPIGYQTGSYVQNFLVETFNIAKSRLIPLDSIENYTRALSLGPNRPGGVAAIVDEFPYIQLFLSKQCGFTTVGGQFSKSGWGFAFPKDSQLTADISTAILNLSENGQLQKIIDKWLKNGTCDKRRSQFNSNKFGLNRFWGLFLVMGIICFIALLVFFCRMICLFARHADRYMEDSNDGSHSLGSRSAKILKSFASFVDEKEDDAKKWEAQEKTIPEEH